MKRWWKRLTGDWWVVRRCIWPYPTGYATYNRKHKTLLDTGLTYQQAVEECERLNA